MENVTTFYGIILNAEMYIKLTTVLLPDDSIINFNDARKKYNILGDIIGSTKLREVPARFYVTADVLI